jgi:hypothetical protein
LDYIAVESKVLLLSSKWFEMNLEEKSLRPWDVLHVSLQEDHHYKKTR